MEPLILDFIDSNINFLEIGDFMERLSSFDVMGFIQYQIN